jgi:hypothetical protein
MEEDIMETAEKQTEDRRSRKIKKTINRYKIPALVLIVFVASAFITSSLGNIFTGAVIEKLASENENLKAIASSEQQAKTSEKTSLELEKSSLQRELDDVRETADFYSGIVNDISAEKLMTLNTVYGYQITWDKYVSTEDLRGFEWIVFIKNTDSTKKSFSLDLDLKSNPDGLFEKEPSTGSLVLDSGNSGSLTVDFDPKKKGYAVFDIKINNKYVGDMIVFSL